MSWLYYFVYWNELWNSVNVEGGELVTFVKFLKGYFDGMELRLEWGRILYDDPLLNI